MKGLSSTVLPSLRNNYVIMKRLLIIVLCLCSAVGARAEVPLLGKSMGRWTGFSLESMKSNKKGGLDYLEVTMNDVINKNPEGVAERAAALMDEIREAGLEVWSVHMPYSRTLDISVLDSAKRAENVQFVKDMMRVAAVFRPRYIVQHPSSEPIEPYEREQRLRNSHESIGELAAVAKEIGVVLCVENLPRTCLGRSGEEMMRLIDGYEDVGLCFDTNHLLYQSHADYLKAVAKGKIRTVHLSDYDFADERHLVPGKGLIDNKALWKGIRDNGYDGIMMFECYGEPGELDIARQILLGNMPQPDNSKADSISFANASWQITDLGKGAVAMYARIPMFYSTQSICVVKYPARKFRTEILHRAGESAGKPSEIGRDAGAVFALNAGFFNVAESTPSVYFRKGKNQLGHTHPTELYRVDGLVGFRDRRGRKPHIGYAADTARYASLSRELYSAMASGPVLIQNGNIVVPLVMGVGADGSNPCSTVQFYDRRHPRTVFGTDGSGYVYLVAIDGRFKGRADGASIHEAAYICRLLGMTDAINLDGGGSTTLWTDKTGVINHPCDNRKFDHEGERTVPNLIAVY